MERGAGNPLFLQKLASVGEQTDEAEELPETVEALVATRIDQLGPGDRALLRWASVLGVSFSGSLIADVLEDDPLRWRGVRRRGIDWASSSSGIPTSPARSASVTRSSATRRTKDSRTGGVASSTAVSPRSSSNSTPSGPKTPPSCSRCTTSTPAAGRRHGRIRASRAICAREVYANVDAASFYERAIEVSSKSRPRGRRARADLALARRGARRGRRLPRSDRRAEKSRRGCSRTTPW